MQVLPAGDGGLEGGRGHVPLGVRQDLLCRRPADAVRPAHPHLDERQLVRQRRGRDQTTEPARHPHRSCPPPQDHRGRRDLRLREGPGHHQAVRRSPPPDRGNQRRPEGIRDRRPRPAHHGLRHGQDLHRAPHRRRAEVQDGAVHGAVDFAPFAEPSRLGATGEGRDRHAGRLLRQQGRPRGRRHPGLRPGLPRDHLYGSARQVRPRPEVQAAEGHDGGLLDLPVRRRRLRGPAVRRVRHLRPDRLRRGPPHDRRHLRGDAAVQLHEDTQRRERPGQTATLHDRHAPRLRRERQEARRGRIYRAGVDGRREGLRPRVPPPVLLGRRRAGPPVRLQGPDPRRVRGGHQGVRAPRLRRRRHHRQRG